ncbi:hypothetical protein B296_00057322 [Ensete ventricosum]|uniref:Uncharacterized protein n=1 Tax=Ensete ventricosum TaxID=4639 RepID=A0A426XRU1_ENSVE|nr:hypothetical protein B296_00057322 [Ensete ventricosum]
MYRSAHELVHGSLATGQSARYRPASDDTGLFRTPGYNEGRRSVEGEGRRRGHSKKWENRENLNAKSFLDPDLTPPSLDDYDPGGNGKVATRAAKEEIPSSPRLRFCGFFFVVFFAEGRRCLRPSTSSSPFSSNVADEATREEEEATSLR